MPVLLNVRNQPIVIFIVGQTVLWSHPNQDVIHVALVAITCPHDLRSIAFVVAHLARQLETVSHFHLTAQGKIIVI